jgi:hypothetical protein
VLPALCATPHLFSLTCDASIKFSDAVNSEAAGATMLRITANETKDSLFVKLEGKLAGPWVDELAKCLQSCENREEARALRVDLAGLTFVDVRGKELLRDLCLRGTELVATGCLMRAMIAEVADCSRK